MTKEPIMKNILYLLGNLYWKIFFTFLETNKSKECAFKGPEVNCKNFGSGALPGSMLDLRLLKISLGIFFLALAGSSNPAGPCPNP